MVNQEAIRYQEQCHKVPRISCLIKQANKTYQLQWLKHCSRMSESVHKLNTLSNFTWLLFLHNVSSVCDVHWHSAASTALPDQHGRGNLLSCNRQVVSHACVRTRLQHRRMPSSTTSAPTMCMRDDDVFHVQEFRKEGKRGRESTLQHSMSIPLAMHPCCFRLCKTMLLSTATVSPTVAQLLV